MNNLNELAKQFHERSKAKGFWDNPKETGTLLMLMVTELGEACQADRENRYADKEKAIKLLYQKDLTQFVPEFKNNIKDSFEDELADVFIRLMDFVGQRGIDIETHIELKMRYNLTREKLHGKLY